MLLSQDALKDKNSFACLDLFLQSLLLDRKDNSLQILNTLHHIDHLQSILLLLHSKCKAHLIEFILFISRKAYFYLQIND